VPPDRTGNGLAIRAGVTLEALAEQFDVRFVYAPVYGEQPMPAWVDELTTGTLVLSETLADPFIGTLHRISSLGERRRAMVVYPLPFPARFSTPEAVDAIAAFGGLDVDLVYVFRLYLAPLAQPWLAVHPRQARVVLDLDEEDARVTRQIAELHRLNGDDDSAAVSDADAAKLERMAHEWIPRADLVLVASEKERVAVEALVPGVTAHVLFNSVPPTGEEGVAPAVDLLFVGNLSYLPNIDGARWFCRDVLPLLRHRLGRHVRVGVVGSAVDPRVADLASDPDVMVVPDLPSVTPWYRAATVAVVPLRSGGGSRLKILEAFAHRIPVISTARGAEGLPVTDGVHLLIADSEEHLAEGCARLIDDASLRESLVEAAASVASEHARPRIVARLAAMLTP